MSDLIQFLQDNVNQPTENLRELMESTGDGEQKAGLAALIDARTKAGGEAQSFFIPKLEIKGKDLLVHMKVMNHKIDRAFPEISLRFEFDGSDWEDRIAELENELTQLEGQPPLPIESGDNEDQEELENAHENYKKQVEHTKELIKKEKAELKRQREENQDYVISAKIESLKYHENSTDLVLKLEEKTFFEFVQKYRDEIYLWASVIINRG